MDLRTRTRTRTRTRARAHSASKCDVCTSPFSPAPSFKRPGSRGRGTRRAAAFSPGASPQFHKVARSQSPVSRAATVTSAPPLGSSPKYPASASRAPSKARDSTEEWMDSVEELLKSSPPGQAAGEDLARSLGSIVGEGQKDEDNTFTQSMRLLDQLTDAVKNYNHQVKEDLRASVEAAIRAQEYEGECEMEEFAGERDPEVLREDPKGATCADSSLNVSYRPAGFSDVSTDDLEDIFMAPECRRCGDLFNHFLSRNGIPRCGCWSGDSEEDAEHHLHRLEDLHL